MPFIIPERADGPRTTPPAVVAFAAAEDALGAARSALDAASRVDWVSSAADGYRRLLSDAAQDLARLGAALGGARSPVLRHTRESDAAREAEEIERAACRIVLPVWVP
jgi:hypothetical protein